MSGKQMHQQQQQPQQQQQLQIQQQQHQQQQQQQHEQSPQQQQNPSSQLPPSSHSNYHHQRAPRTPESYFNVPESIALLNIVKSDRIQSAFQSNRKNHASVWEMVAEVLSRYNNRKRSAKQCCNRYENLKKIYTQLKRNPEKHVRRNWPYMYLFRQIEEQRGECWGSSAKRRNELSYYQRRRALMLMNTNTNTNSSSKDLQTELLKIQQSAIAAVAANITTNNNNCNNIDSNTINNTIINTNNTNNNNNSHLHNNNNNCIKEQQALFVPNQFVQTEIRDCKLLNRNNLNIEENDENIGRNRLIGEDINGQTFIGRRNDDEEQGLDIGTDDIRGNRISAIRSSTSSQINLDNFDFGGLMNIKDEPVDTDYEEQDRVLSYARINNNYNGQPNLYINGHHHTSNNDDIGDIENDNETNILHPDVIVDTDHVTDSSTSNSLINVNRGTKRKISTSSDEESTNYELIEYLKRREKRDEEMLKRMEEREERLIGLLERTVVAIERIASHNYTNNNNSSTNGNSNSILNNNNNVPNYKQL